MPLRVRYDHRLDDDIIINGNGQVNQEAPASTADDVYGHDQWYAMTQTAAIAPSTLSDVADGLRKMIRLTQSQAGAQRMGYAQIIEGQSCKQLRGQEFNIAGKLRYSNAAAVRFAILEWTGTEDAVTSDVVNDWTNGTFTAGQFFNSTTLTVRAVGTLSPSAATLADFALSATLGSSFNNLIFMIWTEGTAAQNSTLDFVMKGRRNTIEAPYFMRLYDAELRLARRYYYHCDRSSTFAPMTSAGLAFSTTQAYIPLALPAPMRVAPTLATSTIGNLQVQNAAGAALALTELVIFTADAEILLLRATAAGVLVAGNATFLGANSASPAYIALSSRL